MPVVTIGGLCGKINTYRMFIAKGKTEPVTEKEWINAGRKLLIKLRLNDDVKIIFNRLINEGIDHHFILKEGDFTSQLIDMCDVLGVNKICF